MARAELLDVFACERECDSNVASVGGDVCGICIAVCPFGRGQDDGVLQTPAP